MPSRKSRQDSTRQKGIAPPNPKAGAAISRIAASTTQPLCQSAVEQIAAGESITLPCRNCGTPRTSDRGRRWISGLCPKCANDPKVRRRFPWLRRRRGKSWEHDPAPRPEPWNPTKSHPGTPEKIAAMIDRRDAGQQLHHTGDAAAEVTPARLTALMTDVAYSCVSGVELTKKRKPWRGRPRFAGQRVHLGYFPTRAEACVAVIAWRQAGCPMPTPKNRRAATPPRPPSA
jgi:hypothetical protein